MLILKRKFNELIGLQTSDGFITIRIVEIVGDAHTPWAVKLGFNGPVNVVIHRAEVWRQVAAAAGLELPQELE